MDWSLAFPLIGALLWRSLQAELARFPVVPEPVAAWDSAGVGVGCLEQSAKLKKRAPLWAPDRCP